MNIVLFDFDRTITNIDTIVPLAHFFSVKSDKRIIYIFFLIVLLLYKLKLISDYFMKIYFLRNFVKGEDEIRIEYLINRFFNIYFKKIVNKNILQLLKSYISNGDKVFIVTSNFDFFLQPLLDLIPVTGVFSTKTEVNSGFFTGNIVGQSCNRMEKLNCMLELFSKKNYDLRIAYGDSRGDYELLRYCERSYLVKHKSVNIIDRIILPIKIIINGAKKIKKEFVTKIVPFK